MGTGGTVCPVALLIQAAGLPTNQIDLSSLTHRRAQVGLVSRNLVNQDGWSVVLPGDCCRRYKELSLDVEMSRFCDKFRLVLPRGMFTRVAHLGLYNSPACVFEKRSAVMHD